MQRSDFDVTDKIRTIDPVEVGNEVMCLFGALYTGKPSPQIERAFKDIELLYQGKHADYHPCDTEYHDIQHVLDVTLTTARLLDGYERGRKDRAPLSPDHFSIGVVAALFHDFGYLRRRDDHKHRFGAEYTLTHVGRGSDFLLDYYFPSIGWKQHAAAAAQLVHFTGYERKVDTITLDDPVLRRVGEILGTADIIAQMSDRCYLEKCRDRLYPEFVLGGIARRTQPDGKVVTVFESGEDLLRKTPAFYFNAMKRLDEQLKRAYDYAEVHLGGQNLYLEGMDKNMRYAKVAGTDNPRDPLRRAPPSTLPPGVRGYPEDLVIP